MNSVQLVGFLGADPELRYTASGKAVATLRIATHDFYNGKTTWHRVVVWNKRAEICGERLQKGSQVSITGSLSNNRWTDREGIQRMTVEVVARDVRFIKNYKESQSTVEEKTEEHTIEPELEQEAKELLQGHI